MTTPLDADGALVLPHALIWRYRADLWVSSFWGTPDTAEAKAIASAYELAAHQPSRFRAFIDFSRIEHIDEGGFAVLADAVRSVRPILEPRLVWQALIPPPGVLGAIVCGFHAAVGFTLQNRIFPSVADAVVELFSVAEAARFRRDVVSRIDALASGGLRVALRRVMRERPELTIDEAARALGVSRRTLQRQLRDVGATFRGERVAERIELAKEQLRNPTVKIESIAQGLGFQSRQHFSRQFVTIVGISPSEFRERLTTK